MRRSLIWLGKKLFFSFGRRAKKRENQEENDCEKWRHKSFSRQKRGVSLTLHPSLKDTNFEEEQEQS